VNETFGSVIEKAQARLEKCDHWGCTPGTGAMLQRSEKLNLAENNRRRIARRGATFTALKP
jgi:hypothetical protein